MKPGTIEKHHWKLWMCIHETGRDFLHEWGGKEEMLNKMGAYSTQGRDVWVIDPDGKKHHPDGLIEARS